MDREQQEMFRAAWKRATSSTGAFELEALLADLGWYDALQDDPRVAVSVFFEWQGGAVTTAGGLDRVLCGALGVDLAPVVLPAFGRTNAPARIVGDSLEVHGLCVGIPLEDEPVLVFAAGERGETVAFRCTGLQHRVVDGLDPTASLVEVTGTPSSVTAVPAITIAWADLIAAGQRAVAHELVGAGAAMLELAREHALERIQFGVPIASFQAVRHRLADSLVAVESARGALDAAWEAGTPFDAAVAKAIAGRGARLVARHAQQVLAGIGFTLEHPLHRYVRRVRVLDGLLGDARSLTREVGERLLRERAVPAILPL